MNLCGSVEASLTKGLVRHISSVGANLSEKGDAGCDGMWMRLYKDAGRMLNKH